jgi:hypothetical protein
MAASVHHVSEALVQQAGRRATTLVTQILVILGGIGMGRFRRWADTPPEFFHSMSDQRLLAAAGAGDAAGVAEALRGGASPNPCDDARASRSGAMVEVLTQAAIRRGMASGAFMRSLQGTDAWRTIADGRDLSGF